MSQSPGWDPDGVRDDVRDWAVTHLADDDAVLIGDETGFVKKGKCPRGTAGRTENCQIGTFLAHASRSGRVLLDRELYLPQSWTTDRARCRAVGVPDEVGSRRNRSRPGR
jgi:SRSO17 transposase